MFPMTQRSDVRVSALLIVLAFISINFCILAPELSQAAEITMAWDANSDSNLAGYYLYRRTCLPDQACDAIGSKANLASTRVPLSALSNQQSPRYTLSNLPDDRNFVFVVSAYNTQGTESGFSNEAYYRVPATTSSNRTPEQPATPTGSGSGEIRVGYGYTTSASDPDGDSLQFRYDWGDGGTFTWGGANQSHSWSSAGRYCVRAQAQDGDGARSAWSACRNVAISAPTAETCTISASASSHGHISPSGSIQVSRGTNRLYNITPDAGYRVANLTVDGQSVATVAVYTFYSITADHTIAATFEPDTFTINATAGAHGSISPAGKVQVTPNTNRIFTITPHDGYNVSDVRVDGSSVGALRVYTFTKVNRDHRLEALFVEDNARPTANAGRDQKVAEGSLVTLDGSRSTDSDDGIRTYTWHQTTGTAVHLSGANTPNPTFTAPSAGNGTEGLTFELTVTDNGGLSHRDSVVVEVAGSNTAPVIDDPGDQVAAVGDLFRLSLGFQDANAGDRHTATVNWGDGTPPEGAEVTTDATVGAINAEHAFNSPGEYSVRVCVNDQIGGTGCVDLTVAVDGSSQPVALISADFSKNCQGFIFVDDAFAATDAPDYADGEWSANEGYQDGALKIALGGVDARQVSGISGGWTTELILDRATEVSIAYRYMLTQWPAYESDELSRLMTIVDDSELTISQGAQRHTIRGDGDGGQPRTTGWKRFQMDLGMLDAGKHIITIGAYNNKKDALNEITELLIDDVRVTGMLADGGRPSVGYTQAYQIPQSQVVQSETGDGLVTVHFKIKDPASALCRLHSFAYSMDDGLTWKTPIHGDDSEALSEGWVDNHQSDYSSSPTFATSGIQYFSLDTKHPDLAELQDTEINQLRLRFQVNNGRLDAAQPAVTEAIALNNQGPEIQITFSAENRNHVGSGPMTITATLDRHSLTTPSITLLPPTPMALNGPLEMKGAELEWQYTITIPADDGSTAIDGNWQVLVDNVTDAAGNTAQRQKRFTTDTVDTDSDGVRDYEDADDDNDQLPDVWELQFGLNPLSNEGIDGAAGDFDGDSVSNLAEFEAGSNPADGWRILKTIPYQRAGIDDDARVSINTSFCALINHPDKVDITSADSVIVWVDDGVNQYELHATDAPGLWFVPLLEEEQQTLSKFWLVFDSAAASGAPFDYNAQIQVSFEIQDLSGERFTSDLYQFRTENSDARHTAESDAPFTAQIEVNDPAIEPENGLDAGLIVTKGQMAGTRLIYDSQAQVQPTVGPSSDIPAFAENGNNPIGGVLNLQPPTVLENPVKIIIPCPREYHAGKLNLFFFNGKNWVKAGDTKGNVTAAAEGMMVPGSFKYIDTPETGSALEIRTYQLTGMQVTKENHSSNNGQFPPNVSCFIDAARQKGNDKLDSGN